MKIAVYLAFIARPGFQETCDEAITLQTSAGDEPALDLMLKSHDTFRALRVAIPATTAALNPTLTFLGKMRSAYEVRFLDLAFVHHRGLIHRDIMIKFCARALTVTKTPPHISVRAVCSAS